MAFPGSKGTGSGSGGDYATRVVHLGARSSEARLGTACAAAEAGVRGGALPASAVLASERVHGPLKLAHEDREGTGVLTEGAGRTGRPCSVDGVDGGRWRTAELAVQVEGGRCRVPPSSGSRGSMQGRSARLEGGSGRAKGHRWRVISEETELTRGGVRA